VVVVLNVAAAEADVVVAVNVNNNSSNSSNNLNLNMVVVIRDNNHQVFDMHRMCETLKFNLKPLLLCVLRLQCVPCKLEEVVVEGQLLLLSLKQFLALL
jgi:hypothetical protein